MTGTTRIFPKLTALVLVAGVSGLVGCESVFGPRQVTRAELAGNFAANNAVFTSVDGASSVDVIGTGGVVELDLRGDGTFEHRVTSPDAEAEPMIAQGEFTVNGGNGVTFLTRDGVASNATFTSDRARIEVDMQGAFNFNGVEQPGVLASTFVRKH